MNNILFFLSFLISGMTIAQHNPVTFEMSQTDDTIVFHANIETGWHLYAVNLPDPTGGPLPTEIVFEMSENFKLIGDLTESKGHTEIDDAFGIEVTYFENSAYFKQRIEKLSSAKNIEVKGNIYYMVCNDEMCIPLERAFSITIN